MLLFFYAKLGGKKMALAGVSTLGIKFGYAVEAIAGTKPTAFTQLTRISAIGGISLETEQIDASALEDEITRYIAGRQDTGGTFAVTVNLTDDTIAEWESLISASKTAQESGKSTWFTVWSPYLSKAFFIVAEPPKHIPMPESNQNELQTVEMTLVINEYKGMAEKIEPAVATTP